MSDEVKGSGFLAGFGIMVGLVLGGMMVGTWIDHARAAAVAPPAPNSLQVHGPDVPAIHKAIGYWNGVAGREVARFVEGQPVVEDCATAGGHAAGSAEEQGSSACSPRTVTVQFGELDGYAGLAAGHAGHVPTRITIDPEFLTSWKVWAHELGHALGFDDYNTGSHGVGVVDAEYEGVMSYASDEGDKSDDEGLLRGSWVFTMVSSTTIERG